MYFSRSNSFYASDTTDRVLFSILPVDLPGPPRLVHVKCHSRDVLLEWQPTGDGRAPILSYSIQYNTSFSPNIWEDSFKNVPASDTKFTLPMSPWVNYSFRVVARNKVGFSLPSEVSETCTTHEDVPYNNPDHVTGRGERPDNLVITWTPMPPIEHNAPGFHYKVLWKRDDKPRATWNSHLIDDWRQNRHVVSNQPTFKPYRIKVEAYNRLGQANTLATEFIGYSGEDVPLAAPKEFRLVEIRDGRTAVFSWSPVSQESVRGHFRGYKIQTWTTDEGKDELKEIEVSANVSTAMASLFRPFSRNVVQVLAYNGMYNGPPSDTLDFLTPEAVPGPVASFDGRPLGSRAAYLSWKPPLEPNGLIKGYRIYYEEVRGGMVGPKTERRPPVTGPQRLHAKLTGLKPRTKYRFTIRAETYAGQGSPYFFELETPDESENLPDVADFTWTYLPGDDGRAGVRDTNLQQFASIEMGYPRPESNLRPVTWLPAMTKHLGRDFYVQYRHKGENTWQNTEVEEYEDTIVLEGLDKNDFYEVRIVVVDGKYQKYSQIEEVWTGTLGKYVPSPPEIVHVECEASSALLKWTPRGDNQASIISYSVQYSTSFNSTRGSWQDVAANIPASDTSVRMALSPWANYTFRVLASNKVGPSAPSEPSATTCATPENVPFKNPDSVTGRWNIYGDLIISWMSMAPIDHNAPGFFYRVSWKRNDLPNATWSSHDVKDWTQERLVLQGQSRSTPYSVRVEAHNSLGQANVLPREIGVPTSNKTNIAGMMDAVLSYFQSVF
ncbi:hypothetical protein HPB51_026054 [Rhipicephalus microplus]|uniref:Fibronectin type-III domain-containing protein n=1 Tax=Rhipicephalus microplus TaxID=6941 RepID=A0A9J6EE14_RHIMP|nr:hypothetical protein HPB51_026054 [Rhipicephalus microplus]